MDAAVYDNAVVRSHPIYPLAKNTLKAISDRDYPNGAYPFDQGIECLDMDSYEHSLPKNPHDKTVDAVIGISTYVNNRTSSPRLLLVELRMGYESADNVQRKELVSKVRHTIELLGHQIAIEKERIFVFNGNVAPQAISKFAAWKRENNAAKDFTALSVNQFIDNFPSYASMPYTPTNNPDSIRNEIISHENKAQWNGMFACIKRWKDEASRIRGNYYEYRSIIGALKNVWSEIRLRHDPFHDADMEIEAMIVDEDLSLL